MPGGEGVRKYFGKHCNPAYMSDEVRAVCLNCPHGRCIEEQTGCAEYRAAIRRVTARTKRHSWARKEA